jgi:hypothetical protein
VTGWPGAPTEATPSQSDAPPDTWHAWLAALFPDRVVAGFADRHVALWEWAWRIEADASAAPFVACWPRGGGKSTTTELVAAAWGARGVRRYVLYVCETQDQADDHVQNIAALLESAAFGAAYPTMAERAVGKFGNSKGWRRNRVRTASGFVVDALGLDTAARGMNIEGQRPDAIIIDDIDSEDDSEAVTTKKQRTLTRKVLPTAAPNAVYMFVQNRVHDDSLMAQCIDARADFLGGRIMDGPHPAIRNLDTVGEGVDAVIVGGTATWPGQDIAVCQDYIRKWGLDAFLSECQHQSVAQAGRFLEDIALWDACRVPDLPPLDAHTPVVLAMDAGETSDTFAIAALSRHPRGLALRFSRVYVPQDGQALDFDAIEQDIRDLVDRYAVIEVAYDRFLLGQMMRRFRGPRPLPAPLVPFNQAGDRLEADKALADSILTRTLVHDGTHHAMREHLDNANARRSADGRQLRIVKRSRTKKIDAAVTLSMAAARAAVVLPAIVDGPLAY